MVMDRNDFFVGGSLVTPASDKRFVVLNPATEETVGSAPPPLPMTSIGRWRRPGLRSTAVRGHECPLWSEVPSW